jgi:hypothetical protein
VGDILDNIQDTFGIGSGWGKEWRPVETNGEYIPILEMKFNKLAGKLDALDGPLTKNQATLNLKNEKGTEPIAYTYLDAAQSRQADLQHYKNSTLLGTAATAAYELFEAKKIYDDLKNDIHFFVPDSRKLAALSKKIGSVSAYIDGLSDALENIKAP